MTTTKPCAHCGKPFKVNGPTNRYCRRLECGKERQRASTERNKKPVKQVAR